jgi:type II secretory pathway component PulC
VGLLLAALLLSCGSSTPAAVSKAPPSAKPAPSRPVAQRPKPPAGALFRDDVIRTVDGGLGRFLQHVVVDAALKAGKFVGFRIVELRPLEWWKDVDLKPGDVVLRVNDMPIERETQAYEAFEALRTAERLTVTYLRAGEQRQLSYRIIQR